MRSPPLHRGDSELPKSGSTIQGAPGKPRKFSGEKRQVEASNLGEKHLGEI